MGQYVNMTVVGSTPTRSIELFLFLRPYKKRKLRVEYLHSIRYFETEWKVWKG